jgi:quercetin dioxygenase-like cupin family protein
MSSLPITQPIILAPGTGRKITAFGDEIIVHLDGTQTGGQFTMFTSFVPPGGGPPIHYHNNEDEWFFPLEGRVEFYKDNAWTEVAMGSVVFMPKGTIHTFRNPGDKPLKMLVHTRPSGFEVFFSKCAEVFAAGGAPDMQKIQMICKEHGICSV